MSDTEFIVDFIGSLNPMQLEAVMHTQGPLLVLAGAGTGKTKVLTTRIANIIQQNLATPQNILAVTFTNKAAKEMTSRINALIPSYGLNIGTFHSISAKILRSHATALNNGLSSNFTIIDPDDQLKLVKEIALQQNIDVKTNSPKLLLSIISRWKDMGLLPAKISVSDLRSQLDKMAQNVYSQYQQRLLDSNAVDFGDLLLYNNELLITNPGLLEFYQEKYKYILIDEYQDTNPAQYLWARMLASKHKNICCVGDDDQSIYSWRGAEVGNILRFSSDFPNSKVIKLEQNYRSTSKILQAASSLIKHNKQRHDKTLWTNQNEGEKIKIISCWSDKEEARFVVSEIERLMGEGKYNAGQIAVLLRAGFQTRPFEEIFISNALPYKIIGGLRFYERMEIRDVLAYIRIVLNSGDNLALERIINVPKRAIGNTTLKNIKDHANEHNLPVLEAIWSMLEMGLLKNKPAENLRLLTKQLDNWKERYKTMPPVDATKLMLEESGYLAMLKAEKTEESRARLENINEMLRAINEFSTISEFIEHSSLVMENDVLENNFGGAVTLMTLHAAKGLEFDLVFLPGWEEGIFPHQKALTEEGQKGLEEERRIAYVGLTRAKKDLYITFAENRWMFYEVLNSIPSRFLAEIPDSVCVRTSSTKKLNYYGSRHNVSLQTRVGSYDNYVDSDSGGINNSGKKGINYGANLHEIRSGGPQTSGGFTTIAGKEAMGHSANQSEKPRFKIGAKIQHKTFGVGTILRQIDDNLEIIFPNGIGIKTIKQDYVMPLLY